ncbi:cystine/glutamate transporter-like isoform X3 [Apostichopus japonicus]|uniref:cystine/glutamate transporter-like isoform X3 n=1 Tax=Stichopus japonicus TaxID=307972 RepID=UPI003AB87CF8
MIFSVSTVNSEFHNNVYRLTMEQAKESRPPSRSSTGSGDIILTKQVTLLDCTVLIAGTVIGSGIFISPKGILDNTGSVGWALIIWCACGIFSGVGALCYAELASSIPESGGDYSYLRHSFGPWVSFLRIWTGLLAVRTGGAVVVSLVAAKNIILAFGGNCAADSTSTALLAFVILASIFYFNCWSVSLSRSIQVVFTGAKVLALMMIIISGLWVLSRGNTDSFHESFDTESVTWIRFPRAFYSGLFAYSGWQYLPQVTEEILNPGRNVPLSIIIATTAVTALYLLTNLAYFAVLSPFELLASESVAVTFGQRVLGPIWWILPIFVAVSCIGSINGGIFSTARMFFVASREGQLPVIVSMIHINKRTPLPAAACMVPLVLAILFALCAVFMVVASILSAFYEFLIGLLITVAGIPVYAVCVWWQSKPAWWNQVMEKSTVWMQKLLLVVPQERATYVKNF